MQVRAFVRYASVAVLSAAALTVINPVAMKLATERHTYRSADDAPKATAALVLGASVARGQPSPILEERAHAAAELYRARKVSKILVTGDSGSLSHDEVTPVRKYLLAAGIPAHDIFLDHAGFDTYSSMYRAREVFLADSLVVVTQDFHMPRALFIARSLGIEASGLVPEKGKGTGRDYIREIPASAKAAIDVLIARTPKYLGDAIPLDGDGSTTWY